MKNNIYENLKTLRKAQGLTLEGAAEKLGVSRQTVAKWENGETAPDLENCVKLSELYGVTIDSMVRAAENREERKPMEPAGKHIFGMVRVNDKGQITLPKRARDIFDIRAGDFLLILGDEAQGIAVVKMGSTFELPEDFSQRDPEKEE